METSRKINNIAGPWFKTFCYLLCLTLIACASGQNKNELNAKATEGYKKYLGCMRGAAEFYAQYDGKPETMAEAAHSACMEDFQQFHKDLETFYLSNVSRGSQAFVIEDTLKQMPEFEKRAKQLAIKTILDIRIADSNN
jgi:hypothetical protein